MLGHFFLFVEPELLSHSLFWVKLPLYVHMLTVGMPIYLAFQKKSSNTENLGSTLRSQFSAILAYLRRKKQCDY
jgi:hypothetical protein